MTIRIAVALLLLVPIRSAAQTPLDRLSLDAAVRTAVARNAGLRAARAGVDQSAAETTRARSGFFPRISVSESWQRGDQPVFVFSSLLSARRFAAANFAIDALNHPKAIGFFQTSVGVEQLIFDGGRTRAAAAAADLSRTIAEYSATEAATAVALSTTQTFGRIVVGEAARRAADAGLAAAREDLARAERRRDAGLTTDADVLALVVHVANLQRRSIQAEGDASSARAELNRLMGAPIEAPVSLVEPSAAPLDVLAQQKDLAALLSEADKSRPELARAAATEGVADSLSRQARAAFMPRIAARAAVDVSGTRVNDRAASWIAGGELQWTFSTGRAEVAAARSAAAGLNRARAQTEDARAAVHVEVVTALRRFETARAELDAGRTAVEQAQEAQRIIRDRFDCGIASVNDVLQASSAVLDAEANHASALVDTMTAAAMLRRALGRNP